MENVHLFPYRTHPNIFIVCIPLVNVESPHCQRIQKRTAFSSMLLRETVTPEIPHFEMLTVFVSFYLLDCQFCLWRISRYFCTLQLQLVETIIS